MEFPLGTVAATDLIAHRDFGKLIVSKGGALSSIPIMEAASLIKLVDPDGDLVSTARAVGVSFGDWIEKKAAHHTAHAAISTGIPI